MNILVVDDETLARNRLRTLLADCAAQPPHMVREAASAKEALGLLSPSGGQAFDLLLLDIHMPGQDGLCLAQNLRALSHPPAVVFVTAHADHAVSAFELDAIDYLTKPVRLERLQQALAKVQRTQRPAVLRRGGKVAVNHLCGGFDVGQGGKGHGENFCFDSCWRLLNGRLELFWLVFYSRTVPLMQVTVWPPTQISAPSCSTCTRPARPSAVPWLAT